MKKEISIHELAKLVCNMSQAGELAGVSREAIRLAVERDELQAAKLGRETMLLRTEVFAWAKKDRPKGRPPKKN